MKTLIVGGVRSGKSQLAERLALQSGLPVTYIATALAGDDEMRRRIEAHRKRRPRAWTVVEEPYGLAGVLRAQVRADRCVVVDCLTLWLTQLLGGDDEGFVTERDALLAVVPDLAAHLVLVTNETGLGVVPMDALSRRFCDEAGRLHQALADCCERVIFTVAGLPMVLKGDPL
jgi:adenosylcobinamide kinase / adenosylcobinamide-phosphate guanylyltransferase